MEQIAFLEGRWLYEFEGGFMEETWLAPRDGSMTGTLRQIVGGATSMIEVFTVTQGEDGEVTLRLRHFDGDLQPWESESDGPLVAGLTAARERGCVFTFDGTLVDTIVYERDGDVMNVTLSFPAERGRDPLELTFKRQ
jgi:hypothetical protein